MDPQDTQRRILEAAEKLFAERGFAATSLRSIVAEAQVNLAAVHYHFGSKEGLIREVLARFIRPVTEERHRRLDELEARDSEPTLEELLDAWLGPTLEFGSNSEIGPTLVRLMGRIHLDPLPKIEEILLPQFETFGRRYVGLLRRVLPDLSVEEISWRMHFAIGTMTYTLGFAHRAQMQSPAASRGRVGGEKASSRGADRAAATAGDGMGAAEVGAPDGAEAGAAGGPGEVTPCHPMKWAVMADRERTRARLVAFLAAAFRAPALSAEIPTAEV
ncbi:MAG: TetR family transcriptional regulator [Candidatus Eisenbacteria bacterium]|uniref:TetR family transcriptional regulator n=1 Tax=Eiseniibacteriota bacterium TaxID=2212470 RepID=A0A956ND97_UNCEI|nr:TetR family transcriptional regulator [Candidatus Eisenbacteria bacterium]